MHIDRVKKETLIRKIEESGCKMLKDKLEGDETKADIVEYLQDCDCPSMKRLFTGI